MRNGKPSLIRSLSVANLACAFGLYISDNMVWFANMGIIDVRTHFRGRRYEWRRVKDVISLWKNIIELVKYLFDALRNLKRQFDIAEALGKLDETMVHKSHSYELIRELISLRSKMRFT